MPYCLTVKGGLVPTNTSAANAARAYRASHTPVFRLTSALFALLIFTVPAAAKTAYKFIECQAKTVRSNGYVISGILRVDGNPNPVLIYGFQNFIKSNFRQFNEVSACKVSRFTKSRQAQNGYAARIVKRRNEGSSIFETKYTLSPPVRPGYPGRPNNEPPRVQTPPAFGIAFGSLLDRAMLLPGQPSSETYRLRGLGRDYYVDSYASVLVPAPDAPFSRYEISVGSETGRVVLIKAVGMTDGREDNFRRAARRFEALRAQYPTMQVAACRDHSRRGFHDFAYGNEAHGVLRAFGRNGGATIRLSVHDVGLYKVIEQEHTPGSKEARHYLTHRDR